MRKISVSIVFALPQQQWVKELSVNRGTSAGELLELSSFLQEIDQLKGQSLQDLQIGVYAKKIDLETLLEDGDRVEIYRPLTADPKEVRRQLTLLGKTMGNKSNA